METDAEIHNQTLSGISKSCGKGGRRIKEARGVKEVPQKIGH